MTFILSLVAFTSKSLEKLNYFNNRIQTIAFKNLNIVAKSNVKKKISTFPSSIAK